MAVNKNFVVKNGLEVNSNLLVADLDTQTVGIGTTIAPHELHVVGGIGVTNLNVTGVATIANLRLTGPSTFVGVTTFTDNVFVQKDLHVNGTINIDAGSGGSIGTDLHIQRHVRAGGIVTFSDSLFVGSGLGQSTGTLGQVFQVAGVSSDAYIGGTLGIGTTNPQDLALHVVGDTRFVGVNTFQGDVVVTGNLDVTGDITYDEITGRNLNISGLATFQSLTQNRVAIVGAGDTLNDTNDLRFADNDLSQLVLGVGATVGGGLTVAGNIDANGDLDVDGHTELDNVAISGIVTVTGNIDANSNADINGDLNVNGHTDLDFVIVSAATTFQSDIFVGTGATVGFGSTAYFRDNAKVVLGDDEDLVIQHNGSNSIIAHNGTGDLLINTADGENIYVDSSEIVLRNAGSSETLAKFTQNGSVELYHNNDKKFETTGAGVTVSGGLSVSGVSTFVGFATFSDYVFVQDGLNVAGIITATSFDGLGQIGVGSEGTFIGVGITMVDFKSSNASNTVEVNGTSGIATVTVTTGVSIGLAIALGG